ncbi:zinc finger, CCHC-type containing protein [Tanacetum coccineum]
MTGGSGSNVDSISSLDAGNPLHLQTNDNNSGPLINLKLTESENYKVWATAMKITLQARNKMGFVDCTCTKATYASSIPLTNQWERCRMDLGGQGNLVAKLRTHGGDKDQLWDEKPKPQSKEDSFLINQWLMASMKHMASNFAKLDKFEGVDFQRWQKKMHFLLSSMSVVYVLTTPIPEDGGDDATNVEFSKELKDSLEAKYMAEDASSKKFLVNNFTNYKMIDSRPVMEQYNELLGLYLRIVTSQKANNVVGPSVVVGWSKQLLSVGNLTLEKGLQSVKMLATKPMVYHVTYVSKAYFVQDDNVACWIEQGPTVHVCKDRCRFKTYELLNDGSISSMGHKLNIVNNIGKSAFMSTFKLNDSIICYQCDLNAIPSLGNKKYFVTFIDDASRFCYVSLLHTKDEALDKLKVFKTEVKLHQRSLIKRFRTDRRELSQGFWGEAMLTACYLLNRVPNKRNMITPYELWTKRKPNLNYLRVWGCRAVVRLPDLKLKTLGERGIECIFVGYAEHSKAFRFYVIEPNESVSINSIIESRDAIFDENRFSSVPRPSLRIPNRTEDIGGSVVPEEVTEEVVQQPKPELRKSKRNRTPKDFRLEFQLYLIKGTRDEISDKHSYCFNVENDPKTFDEAMKS